MLTGEFEPCPSDRQRSLPSFAGSDRAHFPDLTAILPDRAVRRESSCSGGIKYRHSRPVLLIPVGFANHLPAIDTRLIVRKKHLFVIAETRSRGGQFAISIREKSRLDQVNSFPQCRVSFVQGAGVIAVRFSLSDSICAQAEQKEILSPHGIPDFNIRDSRRPTCRS